MNRLQGKVALITGSDSGIGRGTAIEFAKEGADVVVHYLHDSSTREHVEARAARPSWSRPTTGGRTRWNGCSRSPSSRSGTWTSSCNLIGQLICCKHFINHRKQQGGGGKILNTTSVHEEQARAALPTTTAPRARCAT